MVMVPLIGLGSDQVDKSTNLGQHIEAYHVDENHGNNVLKLVSDIVSIKIGDNRSGDSIILFCSPQSLEPDSKLSFCLHKLENLGLITSVFVDEVDTIHRDRYSGSRFH